MSRQQFLAELIQYLTFVTPAEREQIIAAFEEKFDSVGPEGETQLLMELGTPMSIAIALKRRKEAGELAMPETSQEEAPAASDEAASATEEPPSAPAETPPAPEAVPPAPESVPPAPEAAVSQADAPEAKAAVPTVEPPVSEALPRKPLISDEEISAIANFPDEIPAMSPDGSPAPIERAAPEPRKTLTAGAAFGATVLSLVIGAVLLIPAAAGGYLLVIMANFIVGALKTMAFLTDALWMFAFGFSAGAVGLLILWFFLWAIISCVRRMFAGKPPAKSTFRLGMKKTWKTVWIIFAVFLALGIACGAISFSMNGNPSDLFDNSVAVRLFDWLSYNSIGSFISKLFG